MKTITISDEIITLTGALPGPEVAIFAGVHGNEQVGILALQELLPKLTLKRGTLRVAFANVPAIAQNVRLIDKNLNRCFVPHIDDAVYEGKRARELMKLLDGCEALLDLHAFNDPVGDPFIICESNVLELATKLEPEIISTNWAEAEPGATDGYMYGAGKIGICVECGPLSRPQEYLGVAVTTVKQFLTFFDMLEEPEPFSTTTKRIIRADHSVTRRADDLVLNPQLRSFQRLVQGEIIGSQAGETYVATEGDYIIFPRPHTPMGGEAFVIGREQEVYTSKS